MIETQLVSVIIPTYNNAQYIPDAVSSALEQTYKPLEIIVVDDGSTDFTRAALEPYWGNIQYIYQTNQGPSVARNRAISVAHGDFIAFLDADDIWLPEKLERQMECFGNNPELGLVHSDAVYLDQGTGRQLKRNVPADLYEGNCDVQLFFGNRIAMSSVVIRRECLEKVGLFYEEIRKSPCEDYDLWMRIARYFEFAYIDQSLVLYRMHAANAIRDNRALRRSEIYVLEKNLKMDPALVNRLGKESVRERFFAIWSEVGYLSFDINDFSEANHCFRRALKFRFDPYIFVLWFASLLPRKFVNRARLWKQRSASPS